MSEKQEATCPMCEYEGKPCPGGAHVFAQYEDGIRTVEDYAKMKAESQPQQVAIPVSSRGLSHRQLQLLSQRFNASCTAPGSWPDETAINEWLKNMLERSWKAENTDGYNGGDV